MKHFLQQTPPQQAPFFMPQQTPFINANDLKENEEIIFDYDSHGNLRSIRKVRRNEGCFFWIALILVIGFVAFRIIA